MKLIIAGSRDRTLQVGHTFLEQMMLHHNLHKNNVTQIVSGVAQGVDEKGEWWAMTNGVKIKRFHANWELHGKAAGPIRNKQMAKYGDALLLVWDGESKGSASMLKEMKALNKPVYEFVIRSEA